MNPIAIPEIPYKGLMPYSEDDEPFFFGRDPERKIITANLIASRLTLLYGASGVGKSSVLRAGVAYHLRQMAHQNPSEQGKPEFAVVVFSSWRDDPLTGLVTRIQDSIAQVLNIQEVKPVQQSATFVQILQESTERLGGDLFIILDQFEEYFLYHPHDDGEGTFAVEFPRAVNCTDLCVNFLISIREESLAKLDRFKGRISNLFSNYLRIDRLDREAAYKAIEEPVKKYNSRQNTAVQVDPALTEAVLEQVRMGQTAWDEVGQGVISTKSSRPPMETRFEAPFLQLVMLRVWNEEMRAGSQVLRVETLNRLGGAERLVEAYLDDVMRGLSDLERDISARMFLYLVTPTGTKIAYTVPDLAEYTKLEPIQVIPVLERLSSGGIRILRPVDPPPGQSTSRYEIFHDVLGPVIRGWRVHYMQEQEHIKVERRVKEQERRAQELRQLVDEREKAFKLSFSRELAAASIRNLERDPECSVLLALYSMSVIHTPPPEAEDALLQALRTSRISCTLEGHQNSVNRVAFSPDGMHLATASADGTVKIWDVASGQEVYTLVRHTDPINSVTFSPDCTRLATASADGTAKVWDVASGQEVYTLEGHAASVNRVAFSPDCTRLATASADGTAKIWDVASGQEEFALRGHIASVMCVAFHTDGNLLATASVDKTAIVWDVTPGQRMSNTMAVIVGHAETINDVAFRPKTHHLATASGDGIVKIWDYELEPVREVLSIAGYTGWINSVAFSPDGTLLATASADRTAKVWAAASGQEVFTLAGHTMPVNDVIFSPDGLHLATASEDRTAKVWDATSGRGVLLLTSPNIPINSVSFSPDGIRLATASADGTAKVWDVASGQGIHTLEGHTASVNRAAFSPDGARLATASADGTAKVWDVASGQEVCTIHQSEAPVPVDAVAFSPNCLYLATANADGVVKILEAASGQEIIPLEAHTTPIHGLAFSPDGTRLATASADGTAKVWDVASGQGVHTLEGHTASVNHVVFSPDGTRLATASADGTAKVWDAISGAEIHSFTGHAAPVNSVAFSSDGNLLATASADRTVKVWEMTSVWELRTLTGHTKAINDVAFSPNDIWVATAGADGIVRVYTLEIRELIMLAWSSITRSLTQGECQKYLHTEQYPLESKTLENINKDLEHIIKAKNFARSLNIEAAIISFN